MSHLVDVKLRVRSIEDAKAVIAERFAEELEFRENRTHQAWYGRFMGDSTPPPGRDPKDYGKCLHTIGRKGHEPRDGASGEYEIGVVAALDGDGFDLLLDSWGPGQALARSLPRLKQEYAAHVALRKAKEKLAPKGFRALPREVLANGRIRLRLRQG